VLDEEPVLDVVEPDTADPDVVLDVAVDVDVTTEPEAVN
tara:strand:- start:66 stop:182 length:117 start_codon:yes stop_codon:yes gene_type:complete